MEGRGFNAEHPARDRDAVGSHAGLQWRLFAAGMAERGRVVPGQMARIEKLVGDVEVVPGHGHGLALVQAPLRVAPVRDLHDAAAVGRFRLTHPEEQQAVTRLDGTGPHHRPSVHASSAWHLQASAVAVEAQSVLA